MGSSAYKQVLHLTPDKSLEHGSQGLRCLALIERSSVSILKITENQLASELIQFEFPFCSNDNNWGAALQGLLASTEFQEFTNGIKVEYWISDSRMSVIPMALFSTENKNEIHNLLFDQPSDTAIFAESTATSDFQVLNAVPKSVCNILPTDPKNAFVAWMEQIGNKLVGKHNATILINQSEFNLIVFENSDLIFTNWFDYNNPEDVLYFLMASLESLNVLHTELNLTLAGDISKGDELYNLISKYIGKVSFTTRPKQLKYSYSFTKIEEHKHSLILSLACG